MNMAIEIHDTSIYAFEQDGDGSASMLLHASMFRSEGEPGRDAGESGWQDVCVRLSGFRLEGVPFELHCYASEGWFEQDGHRDDWSLPFPLTSAGPVRFGLVLSDNFTERIFSADRITIEAAGDFELETVWHAVGSRIRPGRITA